MNIWVESEKEKDKHSRPIYLNNTLKQKDQ